MTCLGFIGSNVYISSLYNDSNTGSQLTKLISMRYFYDPGCRRMHATTSSPVRLQDSNFYCEILNVALFM